MSELRDFELETVRQDDFGEDPPPEKKGKGPLWVVVILLLLLGAGGLAYFYLRQPPPPPPLSEITLPQPEPEPAPQLPPMEEAKEEIDLPPLEESDSFLREAVSNLSAHPQLAKWLVTEGLARRFVVVVDNLAEGVSPRVHLPFLGPKGSFQVVEEAGEVRVDPVSFQRYDTVTDAFTSLDLAGTTELYDQLEPLFQEAYEELGYPDRAFHGTLVKAIDHLLATPVPTGDEVLAQKVLTYDYSDPRLAGLSPAQQQLLRTGPDNVRRIQAKLRQIRGSIAQ
ncbi:MAG: DUF3014 domain-containing protein [Deltaproteobacteria bacterium]|nr:DUF3014 domain-containing protein [Deltaproteobacteria bacterium]